MKDEQAGGEHSVYLALGTNLGEREANLRAAITALAGTVHVKALSSVYETEPWGYLDQPRFLNMVVAGETALAPEPLLAALKGIEAALGREGGGQRYGPRPIDLDILFYDATVLDTDHLTIPHPRLAERAFVLVPLAELAPELVHPMIGRTVAALLAEVDASGVVCVGALTQGEV